MKVRDLMSSEGRVLLKPEYGPISDYWPCLSFTKKSTGTLLSVSVPGTTSLSASAQQTHR